MILIITSYVCWSAHDKSSKVALYHNCPARPGKILIVSTYQIRLMNRSNSPVIGSIYMDGVEWFLDQVCKHVSKNFKKNSLGFSDFRIDKRLICIYPFLCSACFLRLRNKSTTTKIRIKRNTPHATPTAIQMSAETEKKNNERQSILWLPFTSLVLLDLNSSRQLM